MINYLLAFSAGYVFARVLTGIRPSFDMILGWNEDCLGWRPVTSFNDLDANGKYFAGYQVPPEAIERLKSHTND